MTLVIDDVSVPDVLIDLGASCNIVGQQTSELSVKAEGDQL